MTLVWCRPGNEARLYSNAKAHTDSSYHTFSCTVFPQMYSGRLFTKPFSGSYTNVIEERDTVIAFCYTRANKGKYWQVVQREETSCR